MVFLSVCQLIRSRGPDEFWRKRKIFRLSAHFRNRTRNCYSLAIRAVHRALVYATKGRAIRRQDLRTLYEQRITAGAREFGTSLWEVREGLDRSFVQLDRKALSELASWENRSFGSLAALAKYRLGLDNIDNTPHDSPPNHEKLFEFYFKNKLK